ncbi:hypothetical protein [Longimicrobium sp.]|uniref:hypothetical protein n=1 Tax=Longimicrobium sp. TaxID=2029185 RepID=UPI002B7EA1C1|nr:hypothetical protein [Longimicrobium sp.]HSU17789.1 hypothetical protein [Longimicrobium sp.]
MPPLPLGGYYISCPSGLNGTFYLWAYLPYKGHEWETAWYATSMARPLPGLAWYAPVGRADLVSTDGKAKWTNAQVQVQCWIYNDGRIIAYHFDPYRYSGTVTECASGGGSPGGTGFTDVGMDPGYDPYGTFDSGGGSCDGSAGTSGDSGGGVVCHTEYIYIEISYDGGITWQTWWEGEAKVCE